MEDPNPRAYANKHPTSAVLVIEVARSSLAKDLGTKVNQYASARIPEYWVENLVDDCLEVLREPEDGEYTSRTTLRQRDVVRPLCTPDVEIRVDELLP